MAGGADLPLLTPFFWFDPPWYRVPVSRCDMVARGVESAGVVVNALLRDLAQSDEGEAVVKSRRMVPHRSDRAGLIYRDFESATIIDLRMWVGRDPHGRFAYPINQLRRWSNQDDTPADISIDAMSFPPDWETLDDMKHKVGQLRRLSSAAVMLSFDETQLDAILPAAMIAEVDGIILRVEGDPCERIIEARSRLDQAKGRAIRLWIATNAELSPKDCVVCFSLGADGLSLDALCNDLLYSDEQVQLTTAERAAISFGMQSTGDAVDRFQEKLKARVERFVIDVCGHAHSCGVERLSDLKVEHLRR